MTGYIDFADRLSAWFGKAFAWAIMVMALGIGYEVVVRRLLDAPTSWAFDLSYIMYGTLFMMAGAYTLSRDGHVRGDFVYRLWRPRTQGYVELVLYILFFFPGVIALIFTGWKYAARSWRFTESAFTAPPACRSFSSRPSSWRRNPAVHPGIAQVMRCIMCIRDGHWSRITDDIEETEIKMRGEVADVLHHGAEAIDIVLPKDEPSDDR